MATVDDGSHPPAELLTAWYCQRWGCLPEQGALYEQEFRTMYRMTACINIHDALSKMRNLSGKQIHTLTESERRILRVLVDNGLLFNATS